MRTISAILTKNLNAIKVGKEYGLNIHVSKQTNDS